MTSVQATGINEPGRRIVEAAAALAPGLTAIRRDIHAHPELAFEEVRTAGIVAAELSRLGIPHRTGLGRTGVLGFIEGGRPGPTLAIRADMDALPIHEETGLPFASTVGFAPLNVGAKFLASSTQNARSQVVVLLDMNLRNGDASFTGKQLEPGGRLLVSQQLGQRYGLEGNFGFRQRGFKAEGTKQGQYLTTLALNGPLGASSHFGFLAETYATWQRQQGWLPGLTSGLYYRPLTGLRFDVTAGHGLTPAAGGFSIGAGLSARLGK